MAENPLLPGTDIEFVEKYAPGKRLDFPDFGEVCKTTFAKGVITDFEKISDDPITVKPMVKVTGTWGESDYIPLFCHPKAQYWDDETATPPVLATDFDEETGAFRQAWQSFRCGDEVAVMLKEGKPVAVVGFTDGVPRVGEDIVKISTDSVVTSFDYSGNTADDKIINETWPDAYFQTSQAKMYEEAEKGLDGLDLKLLKKADYHAGPTEQESGEWWLDSWNEWPGPEPVPSFDTPYGTFSECVGGACTIGWLSLGNSYISDRKVSMWLFHIGPILYAVFGLWFNARNITHSGYVTDYVPDIGYTYDGYKRSGQNIYGYERFMAKAAIYTEKTKNDIIESLNNFTYLEARGIDPSEDWWPVTPGVVRQNALSEKMQWLCFFDQKAIDGVEWLTRPHTKAELEAVGMWPAPA